MTKMTAYTTLSFEGQQVALAGKEFEGKALPPKVLQGWAAKGWCSPIPTRAGAKSNQPSSIKRTDNSIREMD